MSQNINVQKASGTNALTGNLVVGTGTTLTTSGTGTIAATSAPAAGISGTLTVDHGGTGVTTLTGYVKGSGTSAFTASATIPGSDVSGNIAGNAAGLTNTLAIGSGGTGVTTTPGNGKILIGNGTGYTVANISAGVGVSIANGSGSIQISADGGVNYQGTWNANTNTPTLTSSVGTKGFYYVVNVAGSTNLNGITDWKVGDWALFNGSVWEKVDNTDQVTSVFGRQGAVAAVSTDYSAVGITNTAIGATNPSTGNFTSVSTTTGAVTVGGTGTYGALQLPAGTTTPYGIAFGTDTNLWRTDTGNVEVGGASVALIGLNVGGTNKGYFYNNGTDTTLAGAGTLTLKSNGTTTGLTLDSSNATVAGNLTLSGATSTITLGSTNTGSIAVDTNGALTVSPKSAQTLTVTGTVVNGATQIIGNAAGDFATGLSVLTHAGAGSAFFGASRSAGVAIFTGESGHATVLGSLTNTPVQIGTNGTIRQTISSTGDTTFTGNLTVSGAGTNGFKAVSLSDGATYGGLTLNGAIASGTMSGIYGGGDSNLYATAPTSVWILTAGTERARFTSTATILAGNLTVSGTGNSSVAGSLGIGTTTPASLLDVFHATAAVADIHSNRENSGDTALLRFSTVSSTSADFRKGGIFYKSDGTGFGRGDFVFALDSVEDSGSVAIGDALMTLKRSGNLGIGTTSPASRLHVKDATGTAVTLLTLESAYSNPSGNKSLLWTDGSGNGLGRISISYDATNGSRMSFGSLYNSGYQTSDLMTLASSGNFLIGGTIDGGQKLQVSGTGFFSAASGSISNVLEITSNDQSGNRFRITNSGSGGKIWSLVGGNPGANNADFTIYDESNSVKALVLTAATGDATFASGITLLGSKLAFTDDGTNINATVTSRRLQLVATGSSIVTGYNTDFYFSNETSVAKYNGNFGIGTTAPSDLLSLEGTDTGTTIGAGTVAMRLVNLNASGLGRLTEIHFGGRSQSAKPFAAISGVLVSDSLGQQAGDLAFSVKNVTTATNPVEAMRLFANGNLFVGASPVDGGQKLQVSGSAIFGSTNTAQLSNPTAQIIRQQFSASTVGLRLEADSANAQAVIGTSSNHSLHLRSNDTTALTLDSSQNAKFEKIVGTTDALYAWGTATNNVRAFQLTGGAALYSLDTGTGYTVLGNNAYVNSSSQDTYMRSGNYATVYSQVSGEHRWYSAPSGTAGNAITFTKVMQVNASGGLQLSTYGAGTLSTDASGNVTASSDVRLKTNLRTFARGLADVLKLAPKTYNWNETSGMDTSGDYVGFVAQDVQSAIPEAVYEGKDANKTLTLNDRAILAALVNAVKELNAKLA